MPESDPPKSGEPSRNLPATVQTPGAVTRETWFGRVLRAMFGGETHTIREDLETLLKGATGIETGFSPAETRMLRNVLGLHQQRIDDVMVPRADIVAVQQDTTLGELVKLFEGAAHSRLVVFNETLDDPVGIIHIRDLIAFITKQAVTPKPGKRKKKAAPDVLDFKNVDFSLPLSSVKIVRPLIYVPPSAPAVDLLARMQATRIHLALVIDEYGGTDGLVSMEDVVEQVVGDIEDEHDEASIHTVARQNDGAFLADGRATLEDVIAAVGPEFDTGEDGKDIDTIGGFVVARVGRVPVRGELVPGPGLFEFEVLDADPRRIKKIRIARSRRKPAARPREGQAITAPSVAPPQDSAPPDAAPAKDPQS